MKTKTLNVRVSEEDLKQIDELARMLEGSSLRANKISRSELVLILIKLGKEKLLDTLKK